MSSTKKKATVKGSAKLKDLKSKQDPKGGAIDSYLKLGSNRMLNPQPLPP